MVEKTKNGAEKKGTPLYVKIFIALFAGIAFGYVLNFMGGVENEIINGYVLPFFQFIGDLIYQVDQDDCRSAGVLLYHRRGTFAGRYQETSKHRH